MKYSSSKTIESRVAPGVRVTILKMNKARRDALQEQTAELGKRYAELLKEFAPLDENLRKAVKASRAVGKAERLQAIAEGASETAALERFPHGTLDFPDEKFARWSELNTAMQRMDEREIEPANLRFCVKAIEGLEIDGEPATLELVLQSGSDELREEIALAVKRELGLSPEEKENLLSPSTSAAQVDGNATSGNVPLAERPDGTIPTADAESSTVLVSAPVLITSTTP